MGWPIVGWHFAMRDRLQLLYLPLGFGGSGLAPKAWDRKGIDTPHTSPWRRKNYDLAPGCPPSPTLLFSHWIYPRPPRLAAQARLTNTLTPDLFLQVGF